MKLIPKLVLSALVLFIAYSAMVYLIDDEIIVNGDEPGTGAYSGSPTVEFLEEFSGDFPADNWAVTDAPQIVSVDGDPMMNSSNCKLETSHVFSTAWGVEFSMDVLLPQKKNSLIIYIFDEQYPAVNQAKLVIQNFYDSAVFWIRGHYVTPSPEIVSQTLPFDGNFHNIKFIVDSNADARWLLDGQVIIERSKFMMGNYYISISADKCISDNSYWAANCTDMLIDNIKVTSLGQTPQEITYETGGGGGSVFKNHCNAGYCWSNGACCPSAYQYYCSATDKCYSSQSAATRASNGACVSFRVVC